MYIAMNRFRVAPGREHEFEKMWRERESYLDEVPGFLSFRLLRGEPQDDETIFISFSQWESAEDFAAWTRSQAFVKAHRQAKSPEGLVLGHPRFEGYKTVDLTPAKK